MRIVLERTDLPKHTRIFITLDLSTGTFQCLGFYNMQHVQVFIAKMNDSRVLTVNLDRVEDRRGRRHAHHDDARTHAQARAWVGIHNHTAVGFKNVLN